MAVEFDDVLEEIGSFGRYQKYAIFLFLLPNSFFSAFMMNQLLFQLVVPDHWCHVPGREVTGMTRDQWRAITIPRTGSSGKFSSCRMYNVTWSADVSFSLTNHTGECAYGWEYESSQYEATVATTNEWYCEKESNSQHALALNMAGNALGTLILPYMGDKYVGRRVIMYVALVSHVLFTIPLVWVSNLVLHLIFRFLAGLGYLTYSLVPYVIVVELVGGRKRALTTGLYYGAWTSGMCFTALVAFLMPHWQHLALISCLPPVSFLLFLHLVPESPRWLMSRGRVAECAEILLQVAKTNGNPAVSKQDLEDRLRAIVENKVAEAGISIAFRFQRLRCRIALLMVISMCVYMSFGVTFMGINVLSSNNFLSHFILSASQFPANVTSWAFLQYLGRRFSCMASAIIFMGLCILATFYIHDEWVLVLVTGAMKVCQGVQMQALFVVVVEILPTPVRSSGLGLYTVFGLGAMTLSPYILHSGLGSSFQYWVLMAVMGIAFILCIPLPETLGLALPLTFQEAEDQGSGRPISTWIHHWNLHKYPFISSVASSYNAGELHVVPDNKDMT